MAILGPTWQYLAIPSNTWKYLEIPTSTWHYLQYLAIPGNTWQYLGIPWNTCQYLVISGNNWWYLAIPGDTWQYLVIPGNTWWYLTILNNYKQYLTNLVLVCIIWYQQYIKYLLPIWYQYCHSIVRIQLMVSYPSGIIKVPILVIFRKPSMLIVLCHRFFLFWPFPGNKLSIE